MIRNDASGSAHSGDGQRIGSRKRKRKALSCYECRRRKVKCDRGAPSCNRCRETGQGDQCSYTVDPPGTANDRDLSISADELDNEQSRHPGASSLSRIVLDDVSAILRLQAKRITRLEERLLSSEGQLSRPSRDWKGFEVVVADSNLSISENSRSKMQMFIEEQEPKTSESIPVRGGKGFETKFFGASNPTSLVGYFPELHIFMKDSLTYNPSLARIQREIHIQGLQQKERRGIPLASHENLLALLPTRETLDHLAKLYFENFEITYRILHQTAFRDEYNAFWQDPVEGSSSFVVILLLIAATAACLSSNIPFNSTDHPTGTRSTWTLWIETCELWLDFQSQKHLNLANFQVRCLLSVAKQMIGMKEKRAWTCAATLLSFSMAAGLHRDPSLLSGRISIFDQEMRRRLWGTIVEQEIEASIDRGMKPFSMDLPSDCPPPSNLNDEDFGLLSEKLPADKPPQTFTATSFLRSMQKTRSFRTSIISMINDPRCHFQYDEVLGYESKILQILKEIPSWDSAPTLSTNIPRMLMEVQLRQLLLLLHSPWARQTEYNPRYGYSRMVCINTCKQILDQYSVATTSGNYTLCIYRKDVERAALSICHEFYISNLIQNGPSFLIPSSSVLPVVEIALSMLAEKILRLDNGYKNYLFISVAYGLLLSREIPEQSDAHKYEAIERVTRLYRKAEAAKGNPLIRATIDNGASELSAVGAGGLTVSGSVFPITNSLTDNGLQFDQFSYGDFSDWSTDLWPLYSMN